MKIGGRIVYRLEDIEAYEAAHLHQNTSGPCGPPGGED